MFGIGATPHAGGSLRLPPNLPFAEWGSVFDSTTVATAIADQLVHGSEVPIMRGISYIENKDSSI